MDEKKKATGIGGVFIRCQDAAAQRNWYNQHLGFNAGQYGANFEWRDADNPEKKGTTVWSTFPQNTTYFGPSEQGYMINVRVADLEWLLGELKKEGIEPVAPMQVYDYGKFAHITDPEGNRIELWEPADESVL